MSKRLTFSTGHQHEVRGAGRKWLSVSVSVCVSWQGEKEKKKKSHAGQSWSKRWEELKEERGPETVRQTFNLLELRGVTTCP